LPSIDLMEADLIITNAAMIIWTFSIVNISNGI